MMRTGSSNNIKNWWEATQEHVQLFLQVMTDSRAIQDNEVDDALHYINARIASFENSHYPENAGDIRQPLLDAMKHLCESLQYRQKDNNYQAQLRLDMAHASMDALRFRLIQSSILL